MSSGGLYPCTRAGPLDQVARHLESEGPLAARIAEANEAARGFARKRLTRHFPPAAIQAFATYFPAPAIHAAQFGAVPKESSLPELLQAICARTHDFRIGEKAQGMQIGVLPYRTPIDITSLGEPVEPDSNLCRPTPEGLAAAARANASIEVRVLDRHLDFWAAVADDIAATSGADVFVKLFIAGGEHSVNEWHRDKSDVVVAILDGTKRFEVGTANSRDESPAAEVDEILAAGDVLLIPRGRLHNATPTGEVSALLSIGLLRMADWSYRSLAPTHLNLCNPKSPALYRLALRAHAAPTRARPLPHDKMVTRLPGGIALVSDVVVGSAVLAGGQLWQADPETLDQLVLIHASDGVSSAELSVATGRDMDACLETACVLMHAGLVRMV